MNTLKLPKVNLGQFINYLDVFGETHAAVRWRDYGLAFTPVTGFNEIGFSCIRTIFICYADKLIVR